jgi:hypothetical protein
VKAAGRRFSGPRILAARKAERHQDYSALGLCLQRKYPSGGDSVANVIIAMPLLEETSDFGR